MSIIEWVVPGLVAGTLAKILIRSRGSPGVAVAGAIGLTGALRGDWLAAGSLHAALHGFFNLSIWPTAISGAAILLVTCHPVTSLSSWTGHRTAHL